MQLTPLDCLLHRKVAGVRLGSVCYLAVVCVNMHRVAVLNYTVLANGLHCLMARHMAAQCEWRRYDVFQWHSVTTGGSSHCGEISSTILSAHCSRVWVQSV